jgi:hypothetical protein
LSDIGLTSSLPTPEFASAKYTADQTKGDRFAFFTESAANDSCHSGQLPQSSHKYSGILQGGEMMRLTAIILISVLLVAGSTAHEQPDKAECAAIKQKIRHIQSKMRSGYNRAQGERMEAQLRKLRIKRAKKCR